MNTLPSRQRHPSGCGQKRSAALIHVDPATSVEELIDLLVERGINGVPLVGAGRVLGMVTTGDLIHRVADEHVPSRESIWREPFYKSVFRREGSKPNPAEGATAAEVMSRNPGYVLPSDDMAVAARLLIEHRVKSLPVLDEDRLVGMVSRLDLLRCLRAHPGCCNPFKRQD